ncbi:hypothetical protein E3P91_00096 [Wallemia ichthyophaga]|nr:hypothetical protein E3P91_00096 [Wallemia ichthyophaga]
MLILVANEINIPTLSTDIPIQFKKLLQPNKLDGAILLGDVNDKATLDYMRTLCDKVIIGASGSAIMLDKFKVGLVCDTDTQSYAISARKLNVDILLISGPKSFDAFERDSVFYCSPGSMTGTYSSLEELDATPSFILLDIQPAQMTTFVYKLDNDQIKVDKIEYSKLQPRQSDDRSSHSEPQQPAEESVQSEEQEEEQEELHTQNSYQQTPPESPYQAPPIAAETENLWN